MRIQLSSLLFATSLLALGSCATTEEDKPQHTRAAGVEVLVFTTDIAAPVETVWNTVTGPETYKQWTAPFMVGSYFEGDWTEGEKMHFLAPGGSGMVAVIEENRPHEFLSIKHLGFVMNGVEDTTSDAVTSWAPAYENYGFEETAGGTRVTIEQEIQRGFIDMMNNVWPKALAELKGLCETNGGE